MPTREARDLGLTRCITRRDFINGVAVGAAGAWTGLGQAPLLGWEALELTAGEYPPTLTGLRGQYPGSFEVAHAVRDGAYLEPPRASDTGETYDLVVVGGGISGLSAAYLFGQALGADRRVLILDNHDDFGGHAKRNELESGGRVLIGYGGSQSIDTPSGFSPESMGLLRDLGVDLDRFHTAFEGSLYRDLGLGRAEFFDRETFGVDRLVRRGEMSWKEFAAAIPLSQAARADLVRLHEDV
ncbi:MAG: NAD(P)-binding protein, partial [Candidatus Binatia bacterium]